MIPVLETPRLILREWRESDLEPLADFFADEAQAQFVGGACDRDECWGKLAAFIGHWSLRGYGLWVLQGKADGAFKGWSGLSYPPGFPEPELGWCLLPQARGSGLATEAATSARRFAYDILGWTTAISLIRPTNGASIRVAARLGARLERIIEFRFRECGLYRHPGPRELTPTSNQTH